MPLNQTIPQADGKQSASAHGDKTRAPPVLSQGWIPPGLHTVRPITPGCPPGLGRVPETTQQDSEHEGAPRRLPPASRITLRNLNKKAIPPNKAAHHPSGSTTRRRHRALGTPVARPSPWLLMICEIYPWVQLSGPCLMSGDFRALGMCWSWFARHAGAGVMPLGIVDQAAGTHAVLRPATADRHGAEAEPCGIPANPRRSWPPPSAWA